MVSDQQTLIDAFWSQMNKVYTTIPCIVINVYNDFEEQLVDVQPSLNLLRLDKTSQPRPPILGVPVLMPATMNSAITMPVQKGDTVWCSFSMRALEVWQESDGKPSTPNNHAKFHEKDAVAHIGLFTRKNAINNPRKRTLPHNPQDLVIAHNIGKANEVEIRFDAEGKMKITSPTEVEVVCETATVTANSSASITTPELNIDADTTNWQGNINLTGNIAQTGSQTVSGDVTASGKSLATHGHDVSGVQTGGSTVTSNPPN